MPKNDSEEYESRVTSSKGKKKSSASSAASLRNVVAGAVGSDALIDLVERLGLVDLVVGRVKTKIEETDLDELLDDIADYLKRNPDVLVVGLAAITVATGVVVYLNSRREWSGDERRGVEKPERARAKVRKAS